MAHGTATLRRRWHIVSAEGKLERHPGARKNIGCGWWGWVWGQYRSQKGLHPT